MKKVMTPEKMAKLAKVALGEEEADLVVLNANLLDVYTGELLPGYFVAVCEDRIAYVGQDAKHTVGTKSKVIDAGGKTLIPGLIDGHTHIVNQHYTVSEFLRYVMRGGTTTVVTELSEIAFPLGLQGLLEFLDAIENQPIKLFATIPPLVACSPSQETVISVEQLCELLKRDTLLGLGESYWLAAVRGDKRLFELYAKTLASGKKLEGHSAGARDRKLAAYMAPGISSCHEPTTAEETLERLRQGVWVMVREGVVRRDLEAISKVKDLDLDLRYLALCTDGMSAGQLIEQGYMERLVQKAINLGFKPSTAIQMATINVAQHFSLDDCLGGIAPGKYADMVIIPDIRNIHAEYVISNGQVIAQDGELIVQPRKDTYSEFVTKSIHLPRELEAADFAILASGKEQQATVRVIEMVTDLVTREKHITVPVSNGTLQWDKEAGILKVAAIDRAHQPGKMFVGFIAGFGLKRGALAASDGWDTSDVVVVGADEVDMAQAVNRIKALQGGLVVCADGEILAELALPVGGHISQKTMEAIAQGQSHLRQAAQDLGCPFPNPFQAMKALASPAIPFLRICHEGLADIRKGKIVDFMVD